MLHNSPYPDNNNEKTIRKQLLRRERSRKFMESKLKQTTQPTPHNKRVRRYLFAGHKYLSQDTPCICRLSHHINIRKYEKIKDFKKYLPTKRNCKNRMKYKEYLIQGQTPPVFRKGYRPKPQKPLPTIKPEYRIRLTPIPSRNH